MSHFLFSAREEGFRAFNPQRLTPKSFADLFGNLQEWLEKIPPSERYDLYFSLASTKTPRKKDGRGDAVGTWAKNNWECQTVLTWDIDGIPPEFLGKVDDYLDVFADYVGVDPDHVTVVRSGHGFHFYLLLSDPITDYKFFHTKRNLYKETLKELTRRTKKAGLEFKNWDPAIFDCNRVMRVPFTENRKRQPYVMAELIQFSPVTHSISLEEIVGVDQESIDESAGLPQQDWAIIRKSIDVTGVLEGCEFIKWTREKPLEVKEPQGYAALSILSHLDQYKGDESFALSHEYYKNWTSSSSLSKASPDVKIRHALESSPPRTCESISQVWEGCKACPHYKQVRSPISVVRPEFIRTEETHFWEESLNKRTGQIERRPAYDDLLKAFIRDTHYFCHPESLRTFIFTGTHYETMADLSIKGWCNDKMNPKPLTQVRNEFHARVLQTLDRHRGEDAFEDFFKKTLGKVNLKNGVLDVKTRTLSPHDPSLGFKYCLPYEYDPNAKAPNFEKFLDVIMRGDEEMKKTLLDLMGYSLWSGYQGLEAAFWWLAGEGSNGKSRFLTILQEMVGGDRNTRYLKPKNFKETDRFALSGLDGKLLCIVEEVNEKFLGDDMMGVIKDLSSGGTLTVETKGKPHYNMRNTAKFVFTSNKQPILEDTSQGFRRRFIVVPFECDFENGPEANIKDVNILNKILGDSEHPSELPGILNIALQALTEIIARGHKPYIAKKSKQILEELVLESDSVARWMHDHIELTESKDDFISGDEAYSHYQEYMRGENMVSRTTFGARILLKVPRSIHSGRIKKVGGKVLRGYPGIKFRNRLEEMY